MSRTADPGPLSWLALGAAGISAALREVADAIAIGIIAVLNALVGSFQEDRAAARAPRRVESRA